MKSGGFAKDTEYATPRFAFVVHLGSGVTALPRGRSKWNAWKCIFLNLGIWLETPSDTL